MHENLEPSKKEVAAVMPTETASQAIIIGGLEALIDYYSKAQLGEGPAARFWKSMNMSDVLGPLCSDPRLLADTRIPSELRLCLAELHGYGPTSDLKVLGKAIVRIADFKATRM